MAGNNNTPTTAAAGRKPFKTKDMVAGAGTGPLRFWPQQMPAKPIIREIWRNEEGPAHSAEQARRT